MKFSESPIMNKGNFCHHLLEISRKSGTEVNNNLKEVKTWAFLQNFWKQNEVFQNR